VNKPSQKPSHTPLPARSALDWALALLVASWIAKLTAVLFRLYDGGGQGLHTALAPVAILYDDLYLIVPFGLAAWILVQARAKRPAPWAAACLAGGHGILTFWIMFNIPVVRLMSSSVTYGFLHATGGALGDSFSRYLTFANLGVPLALWLIVQRLPRALSRITPRKPYVRFAGVAAAAGLAIAGPLTAPQVEAAGLGGNAVVVLAASFWDHLAPRAAPTERRACTPFPASTRIPTDNLRDLAGIAAGRNVLWVILESTGARALPTYGASLDATPHLTTLAQSSLVFENAYAAYPESIKGLFSMLCSQPPPSGLEASEYNQQQVPCKGIAETFARAGHRTGLFHSSWFAYLGMNTVVQERGFDELADASNIDSPHRSSFGVDDRSTVRRTLQFIDNRNPNMPFFAVYMPIAGHHPYHTPGNIPRTMPEHSERDEHLNDLRVGDVALGELLEGLRQRNLHDKTLYVVVGDHGEAFREHDGNVAHALYLYEENVRVPFIVAAPGLIKQQRRVHQLVSLTDLSSITLSLMGLPETDGHSEQSDFASPTRVVRFFTEQATHRGGLRDDRFKFILNQDNGRTELFDLANDPGERRNLADAYPDRVAHYRLCLDQNPT